VFFGDSFQIVDEVLCKASSEVH